MSYLNIYEIKEELVVFLRNSDVFTISQRGVLTTTEEFNGTGSETSFQVSQATIKNVRSVTVGGAIQTYKTDYDVDYTNNTVTFSTAPSSGTNNVDIQYDYGTDKIYSDFPRNDLSINSFPRMAVDILGVETEPAGYGNANVSNVDITVVVYDKSTIDISNYITAIRTAFIDAQNTLGYVRLVKPLRVGPLLPSNFEKGKNKIMQQNTDFRSYFNYEIN